MEEDLQDNKDTVDMEVCKVFMEEDLLELVYMELKDMVHGLMVVMVL